MENRWDVVVVGGGAAGLSAALMLGRAQRRTLVVDAGQPRNRLSPHLHGALGHEGIDPAELLHRGREEVTSYGVEVLVGEVVEVANTSNGLVAALNDGTRLTARALIVATGLTDDLPKIPGLAEHWGTGVLHCPYCHGWEVREKRLGVLAMPPMGLHQAQLIRQWSSNVVVFTAALGTLDEAHRSRLRSRGIRLVDDPVIEVMGESGVLKAVRTAHGEVIEVDAIFTAGAAKPHDGFLASLDLARAENPLGTFLAVDQTGKTSHDRIWAIGNVVTPGANVPMSIAAGSLTGGAVNMALVTEDFDHAAPGIEHGAPHGGSVSPSAYWEGQYAESQRRWSGGVNSTMAALVSGLPAGDALDLGCGEGGDAAWLAEQGWRVTAVDISPTAVARGGLVAKARGLADRITWIAHDLATWSTSERFDLVTASFFHSTVELPRTEILRRAAGQLRTGGHLLIVSHVFESEQDIPPWAWRHREEGHADPHSVLLTPAQEVAELDLDPAGWEVVRTEIRSREASGPDGAETATVKDGVVLVRRR
jgi:thioredoxin reductase/SAM-dependent methyltransferase